MTFDEAFNTTLLQLFKSRRDVRSFKPDAISDALLDELLQVIALAPSVGLSEPWRIVDVRAPSYRADIQKNFETANAQALRGYQGADAKLYANLKLSGLRQAPVHLAVFSAPNPAQGKGLGRQTMPETLRYSVVGAILLLWLAARARGIGLGWISILDPVLLSASLDVPETWDFVAYLCLGWPEEEQIQEEPELQKSGWEQRRDLSSKIIIR